MKKLILSALAAAALLSVSADNVQAATTTPFKVGKSQYVSSKKTYKLYLPAAGRLITTSKAKLTLKNSADWKCIPYGKKKNTYYLRKGTYYLTSKKAGQVKTNFVKLTKVRKHLETFVETKNNQDGSYSRARSIKFGQEIKGMSNMYNYDGNDYYRFIIDSPQVVTLTMTNNPIYEPEKSNITSKMQIIMFPYDETGKGMGMNTMLDPEHVTINGQKTSTQSWYLAKGSYFFSVATRGLYNFKLTAVPDTRVVPRDTKIESLKDTKDGVVATLSEAMHAKTYELAWHVKGSKVAPYSSSSNTTEVSTNHGQKLVNGQTYLFYARGVNNLEKGKYFGAWTKPVEHTYYAPTTATPGKVELSAKADNTYHNIHVSWDKIASAQSYRVAYRQKGTDHWYYEVTDQNQNAITGIARNKTYEVKLQALNGRQQGSWSALKTVFVK